MTIQLTSQVLSAKEITAKTEHEMFKLLREHFKLTAWHVFQDDLHEKQWVILLKDETSKIAGFSTLQMYEIIYHGEPITIVFSGDTIVAPAAWGSFELASAWLKKVFGLIPRSRRSFWFLISSGWRTYRFLPVFFKVFYPRCNVEMPGEMRSLRDFVAASKFGHHYHSETGLIHLPSPQPLCDSLMQVHRAKLEDEHIEFFLRENPGHEAGDELACLSEIARDNLTPAAVRLLDRGRRAGKEAC